MQTETKSVYRPPAGSRATRRISPRSRASLRGALVAQLPADTTPRRIVFESKLEQRVLHLLLSRPDVYDIWDQPTAVEYRGRDGKQKCHIFDFLVTLTSGQRLAVAVKPEEQVLRRHFRDELTLIRKYLRKSFADEIVLITDACFAKVEALNAARLHEYKREIDPSADELAANVLRGMTAPATIGEIVGNVGLAGAGFRAVYRAIYAGLAHRIDTGEIGPRTRIAPAGSSVQ